MGAVDILQKDLERWAGSAEGKQVIAASLKAMRGKGVGSPTGVENETEAKSIIDQIMIAIWRVLPDQLTRNDGYSIPICMGDIFAIQESDDGSYKYKIYFKEDAVHRDSLSKSKYPKGLRDIVALFATGYEDNPAEGTVHGSWHGAWIKNKKTWHPDPFLQDVVDELNKLYSDRGVTITIGENYQ